MVWRRLALPTRTACLAALALLPPALPAAAQVPATQDAGRARLRDRARPAQQAKLDEAVRKFEDEDVPTKLEGIAALGTVDDRPKAIGYLLQASNDPNASIRLKAIDTLGNMRASEAIPSLVQQLFMRDTDRVTKQHVLVALGKIGDDKATKPILDFLARPGDPDVEGNAIHALGEIGDPVATPALQGIVRDGDPALRPLAQAAIQKIRDKPAPEVIPPALAADRRRGGGEPGGPPVP